MIVIYLLDRDPILSPKATVLVSLVPRPLRGEENGPGTVSTVRACMHVKHHVYMKGLVLIMHYTTGDLPCDVHSLYAKVQP